MSNTKKMTKREMFEQIKANHVLSAEEVAFIDHELELLAKKNSADKKPTAVQVANEGIKQAILDGMEDDVLYTITDLIKSIPELNEKTNQKVSSIVKQMYADEDKGQNVNDFPLIRVEEKRKAFFSLNPDFEG